MKAKLVKVDEATWEAVHQRARKEGRLVWQVVGNALRLYLATPLTSEADATPASQPDTVTRADLERLLQARGLPAARVSMPPAMGQALRDRKYAPPEDTF